MAMALACTRADVFGAVAFFSGAISPLLAPQRKAHRMAQCAGSACYPNALRPDPVDSSRWCPSGPATTVQSWGGRPLTALVPHPTTFAHLLLPDDRRRGS